MPGRLCPGKGQAELLAALALLRARGLRPTTLVVGKDDPWSTPGRRSHRAHLEALARQLGIDDQVQFSAPRADMPDLMAAADVVTVPSWTEPCGLVILETLASGRALLGTTGGGTAELIDTEVDGLLVPPRDSSSLAAALERLLTDAALRADLGARARRKAERCFSTRRMVADAERAYLEIAQDGAATGVAVASVAGARAGHRAARHPMGVRRPQP
jgi:glycosyltransferase involved in cell wall biosynthesis